VREGKQDKASRMRNLQLVMSNEKMFDERCWLKAMAAGKRKSGAAEQ
jgi:hypothetical protein